MMVFGLNALHNLISPITQITPQEQALIAKLVDIETPEPIGLWPFSVAIWGIILFLVASCGVATYYFFRQHTQNNYKRIALAELGKIRDAYTTTPITDASIEQLFRQTNTLLKRCCFTANPNLRHILSRQWGASFYEFLLENLNFHDQKDRDTWKPELFATWEKLSLYAGSEINNRDYEPIIDRYFEFTEHWIKRHKRNNLFKLKNNKQNSTPIASEAKT